MTFDKEGRNTSWEDASFFMILRQFFKLTIFRVIQMDPPSNAEAFVHRCGRTARIGNKGAAVLLLYPSEESYIDFLSLNQKVSLSPLEAVSPESDLLTEVRTLLKSDRGHLDRANRAFVSYIQSYAKHECSVLMRVRDLDLGGAASSYGLLKMPRMPELKAVLGRIVNFGRIPIIFRNLNKFYAH